MSCGLRERSVWSIPLLGLKPRSFLDHKIYDKQNMEIFRDVRRLKIDPIIDSPDILTVSQGVKGKWQ